MRPHFRKLNVDLPRHRLVNERPWMIGGWLLVLAVIIIILVSYKSYKPGATRHTNEKGVRKNS